MWWFTQTAHLDYPLNAIFYVYQINFYSAYCYLLLLYHQKILKFIRYQPFFRTQAIVHAINHQQQAKTTAMLKFFYYYNLKNFFNVQLQYQWFLLYQLRFSKVLMFQILIKHYSPSRALMQTNQGFSSHYSCFKLCLLRHYLCNSYL